MRKFSDHYQEEYVYLADLTDTAALVSWGKFFFASTMRLVPDRRIFLLAGQQGRHTSIGENCEPYGAVEVEVRDEDDRLVKTVRVANDTFAWITGLTPNTEYTYRVVADLDGARRVWADGALHDYDPEAKELVETSRTYSCRFRTFPSLDVSAPLTFAVIGDTGTGTDDQRKLADALQVAVRERDVRLVLMTGDMIYKTSGGAGDDDDEWLLTYFQPYRTIIDHIPFYPCLGNHDSGELSPFEGGQGDPLTLHDNLLVNPRFQGIRPGREAGLDGGLFYRFRYGRDVEFICLDTSKHSIFSRRMFKKEPGKTWMRKALASPLGSPVWRIPFSHHPPYCAGPTHGDNDDMREDIIRRCEANGIRTFLSGHEHNFQCIDSENDDARRRVRCIVTGGAGKWRTDKPDKETDGWMHSWGGNEGTHFLIVTVAGGSMNIEPIATDGKPLRLINRRGEKVLGPIVVTT